MQYIEVDDLAFHYENEPVLENISFEVNSGEFVMLTGENGAAKTTLLRNILGLLNPSKGNVTLSKKNRHGEKLVVGYVPQQVASFNAGFPSTVLELVQSGRYPRGKWFKKLDDEDIEHVRRSLESVGMWDVAIKKSGNCLVVRSSVSRLHAFLQQTLTFSFWMNQRRVWMFSQEKSFISY